MVFGYIAISVVLSYLIGSIPTGFLIGRARGIDLRQHGSGNIGATNAMRVLGKGLGVFVLIVDLLKGWISAYAIPIIVKKILFPEIDQSAMAVCSVFAGVGAVIGHTYTVWLGFNGGKGIATSAGVFLALTPVATLICLGIWLIIVVTTRLVSLGSIIAAILLPILVGVTARQRLILVVTVIVSILVIWRHKSNISRLINGTESRISFKTEKPEKT
jgi:glycerol-3-phosphate acyltransferase PlsY